MCGDFCTLPTLLLKITFNFSSSASLWSVRRITADARTVSSPASCAFPPRLAENANSCCLALLTGVTNDSTPVVKQYDRTEASGYMLEVFDGRPLTNAYTEHLSSSDEQLSRCCHRRVITVPNDARISATQQSTYVVRLRCANCSLIEFRSVYRYGKQDCTSFNSTHYDSVWPPVFRPAHPPRRRGFWPCFSDNRTRGQSVLAVA